MKQIISFNSIIKADKILSLFAVVLVLLFIAANGCEVYQPKSTTTIGSAVIGVDDNILPVIQNEMNEFMRLNKESKLTSNVKTTNELIADLINGDTLAKTVIVSREFNANENGIIAQYDIEIKRYKLAMDGVGIIVHPDNPVSKINYNELKKIYLGEITDWKDLEGDNKNVYSGKIRSYIARKNSSLHDFMSEKILGGTEFAKTNEVCTTSAQLLEMVKNNKLGIGFISMNWVTKFADTLINIVKPLRVASVDSAGTAGDYVSLHQGYIANQTYPLRYELWIFTRDWGLNVASGLINFLMAYDGQKIILNSGLVPVTQPVRIIQLQ